VRTLIRKNQLPAFRLGGKLMRIKGEDVERFEQCQNGALQNSEENLRLHLNKTKNGADRVSEQIIGVKLKRLRQPFMQS